MTDPAAPSAPRSRTRPLPSGVDLHVVDWDPAVDADLPPVLLVHGLASNARMWDGVARDLAGRGHRVVAVDQRGHGRSSKPDDGFDMATVADDLALLIEGLGWTEVTIAGQSWGGNVVIELAHRRPDLLSAVVAVDGGFIDLRAHFPRYEDAESLLAPPRLAGTPLVELEGWVRRVAADWPDRGAGTLANFEQRADGTIAPWLTYERHLKVLRGLWEHSPARLFPGIVRPVLFVVVDDGADWISSKRDAIDQALRLVATGRAVWFPGAHHDVHAQHPREVARLVHGAATGSAFGPS